MLPVLIPYGSEEDPAFSGEELSWANWTLIGLNVLFFLGTYFQSDFQEIVKQYGVNPANFSYISLITSMFLHASTGHLVGNMLFLYAFGRLMNNRLGHLYYPAAYVTSGVVGGIVFLLVHAGSSIPAIGASGAISGVMGLFVSVAPWTKINIWYFWWFGYKASLGTFAVRSIWAIGVWVAYQLVLFILIGTSSIAVTAHLGGFAAGALIGLLFQYDVLEGSPNASGSSTNEGEFLGRISDEELEQKSERKSSEPDDR